VSLSLNKHYCIILIIIIIIIIIIKIIIDIIIIIIVVVDVGARSRRVKHRTLAGNGRDLEKCREDNIKKNIQQDVRI